MQLGATVPAVEPCGSSPDFKGKPETGFLHKHIQFPNDASDLKRILKCFAG